METKSYIYFSIFGDDFDPSIITNTLKIEPSQSFQKGKSIGNNKYPNFVSKFSAREYKIDTINSIEFGSSYEALINIFYDKIETINTLKNELQLDSLIMLVGYFDYDDKYNTPNINITKKVIDFMHFTGSTFNTDNYQIHSIK